MFATCLDPIIANGAAVLDQNDKLPANKGVKLPMGGFLSLEPCGMCGNEQRVAIGFEFGPLACGAGIFNGEFMQLELCLYSLKLGRVGSLMVNQMKVSGLPNTSLILLKLISGRRWAFW